jgi:type I restriction enzyme S subunit
MADMEKNVPYGWKATELGKLLVERKKSGLKVSDAANFGQYPFFTSGEAVLQHTAKQVEGKNIYLATGGVANIKYFSGEAAYSTDTYTVSTSKEVETEYLYFNLLNILYYINANYFQGSGLKHLQKKDFKKHLILFPERPTEQRQIALILSKVDEAINQTEQLITKYQRLKTGLMQDLLTKGIDAHGIIRNEETHAFKDSPLGRIPVEWDVMKLGELISAVDPQPDHRTPPAQVDGVSFIGISDFLPNGEIDTNACRKVGINALEKQQKLFKINKGDLIFGKRGTIGEPIALPDFNKHNFVLSFNVILIKPHEYPDFILWSLKSKYVDEQIKIFINSTSQPSFGMREIRDLDIITPKPDERGRITEKLSKAEKMLVTESESLVKLQTLKTGLMQDLLSGKVRVEQLIRETADV